jgi:hypothetical protein
MRCDANKLTESVFALVLFTTIGALAMQVLGRQIEATRPSLGDIICFSNVSIDRQSPLVLSAVRSGAADRRTCALDTGVMAASNGSLFVEARSSGVVRGFRVHWAGGPTSTGESDCGPNSELMLNAHQLEELAATAGGFGVSPSRGPPSVRRANLQTAATAGVASE